MLNKIQLLHLIIVLLGLALSSCSYRSMGRFSQVTEPSQLSAEDTLMISEISICSTYRTGGGMEQSDTILPTNEDSLVDMFVHALKKNGIPFKIGTPAILDCKAPMSRDNVVNGMMDKDSVKNLVEKYPKGIYLLPLLGIIKWDHEAQMERYNALSFQVHLIKDKEIVYSRGEIYFAPSLYIYAEDLPETNITQENWNELVRRLFEDYKEILQEQNELSN
jgi:hypothetical protein